MTNTAAARETLAIIKAGRYSVNGNTVTLPDRDFTAVTVITPEYGARLLSQSITEKYSSPCNIQIVNSDSYEAAKGYDMALVMNFANAHCPGGGFLMGDRAQEESLCRCSTLYASINSKAAGEMYTYNNTHISKVESDYMLLSENVCVFRNAGLELLESPFDVSVITAPAPNRFGAAFLASKKTIEETFVRRIGIILRLAAEKDYKTLVLGAWGCGAFGNSADDVARYFKAVLTEDRLCCCFENVIFAIYGKEDGKNITAFRNAFSER